ncbi:MAG: hypothetical protein IMW94_06650 [Thermoanaerobacter sp.]|nr:hypothetical protein [Thermoanaerobacter sp.]
MSRAKFYTYPPGIPFEMRFYAVLLRPGGAFYLGGCVAGQEGAFPPGRAGIIVTVIPGIT